MSDPYFERNIEVGGTQCVAMISEGLPGGVFKAHVRLPDGRVRPVPGLFSTEGAVVMAAIDRARAILQGD